MENIIPFFMESDLGHYYLAALVMAVPMARIFKRAGFPMAWTLLLAVPMFGYVFCGLALALQKWPSRQREGI